MAEIIDLAESSDDEPSTTTARNNSNVVICLLDDDNDENDENLTSSTIKTVSQEFIEADSSCSRYRRKMKRGRTCESVDSSDSEDSLELYSVHGLTQRSTKISRRETPHPSTEVATTSATRKPPPTTLADIKIPSSNGNCVKNTYDHRRSKITPASNTSASNNPVATTPASGGTPLLVANPYASKKKATPRASSISPSIYTNTANLELFPPSLTARGKTYPDLRARMTLCLWKYSRSLTRQSYNRGKLDQMVKKIVALSLAEYPIRSLEEYISRFQDHSGNAVSTFRIKLEELKDQLEAGGWSRASTSIDSSRNGEYYTIAEACLVACWTKLKQQGVTSSIVSTEAQLLQKEKWIPASWLLPAIDRRLHSCCPAKISRPGEPDHGVAFYTQASTISAEYKQIEKLCSQSIYLKARRHKGKVVFELTSLGYKKAEQLQARIYPAPIGPYRCSNQFDLADYSNIVMGMDLREGGGGSKVLHQMCNRLDLTKLPYFVTSLAIGDYIFFNQGKLVPVLIERKSIQDVAQSIYDGRWHNQKRRMYHGQYIFGYGQSRLAFIIEGKQERHQVTGGFIGNAAFQVSLDRLNKELENLESEGFDVLRTTSPENSMFELARWAKKIARQVNAGHLEAKYAYAEFKGLVAKIPASTDLSRLAKDHYQNRQGTKVASRPIVIDEDSSPQVLAGRPNPKRLTYAKPSTKQEKKPTTPVNFYSKWKKGQLEQECIRHGLSKSGARDKLVERLLQPRPPKLWVQRKAKGEWVPSRHDVAGTALLVALWLFHQENPSANAFSKNQVYMRAEALCITKNPFSGGTTQTGPFHYDGWSSMRYCLQGDPPLVVKKKNMYRLTRSCAISGYPLAEQLHDWCHEHNNCSCQDL